MKKNYIIKAVLFTLIFILLFAYVSKVVTYPSDYRNYQWIGGFYEEEEGSLDAVYIGSSNCYAFWNSMTAWNEYGIAVYPYSCNAMSFLATEYLIKETRKTQPDALFVVNINTISETTVTIEKVHHLLDYMPMSLNKLELIDALADAGDFTTEEKMECIVPMLRYHGRWSDLSKRDFKYKVNGMKGSSAYSTFLNSYVDITDRYVLTDKTADIPEIYAEALTSLLDYCDEEKVKVLFVTVPRAEKDEERLSQINQLNAMIEERGYDTLYLMDQTDEMGMDITTDFYNRNHTNVHGSIKYTQYLSEYLIENYGFEDKRFDEAYKSWDKGYKKYSKKIAPYVLDIELDAKHRDYSLAKPAKLSAKASEEEVKLTWKAVEGVKEYAIYRKEGEKGPWQKLTVTTKTTYKDDLTIGDEYLDATASLAVEESDEPQEPTIYTYTVVPYYRQSGEKYYGNFEYLGVSVEVQ